MKARLESIPPHVTAALFIDLDALKENWRTLDRLSGSAETGAAVKGDGYGIGLEKAVAALWSAGCKTFFIATPDEGRRARLIVPNATLYVLDGLLQGAVSFYREYQLRPVIGNLRELDYLESQDTRLDHAIHIDTGMSRLGFRANDLNTEIIARINSAKPNLIMSHLACADTIEDPTTTKQAELFSRMAKEFPGIALSLCNSAGIIRQSSSMMNDLVRPGIALYGGEPIEGATPQMKPVVSLVARVLQVHSIPKGTAIGYGAAETLREDSRIATISIGYADGYHRLLGFDPEREKSHVAFNGTLLPLVGRVSMDLLTVDVSAIAPETLDVGDFVEIIGPTITIQTLAKRASTIDYEILTSLGTRFHRIYLEGTKS